MNPVQTFGFDVQEATVDSIHTALFAGKTTCREITLSFLARIRAFNPHINAIICLNPNALQQADNLDKILSNGGITGPLFGIPILLKDNYNTHDMKTTAGCLALADVQPQTDAPTVKALRRAGAIVLGKANMHEMALEGLSVSSLGGQTRNPYDLSRTPGGSSGGSGAAIAASFAVLATGTDTVNSLRSPASANSLFSCRPTRGLITRNGVIPISSTQDTVGPVARCVKDAAIALTVMASTGGDLEDEATALRPQALAGKDYAATVTHGALRGLRFGLLEGFFNRTDNEETTPVNNAMEAAVRTLRKAGATVSSIHESIYNSQAILKSLDTQRYEYKEQLNNYLASSDLCGDIPNTFEELYSSAKFLVIPAQYEYIKSAHAYTTSSEAYKKVCHGIEDLKASLQETFERHNLDALIYPEQASLVVKIGSQSQSQRNGILGAVTGCPVVTVPVGFSQPSNSAPIGVPIGMEILGLPWSEEKLLQIAYQIEQIMPIRQPPALTSEFVEINDMKSVPSLSPDSSFIPEQYPIGTWQTAAD